MLLNNFIKEYNEIYKESFIQDYSSDTFSEINKIQKIITGPKLYPTLEMKSFFKDIKQEYRSPLKICFIGENKLVCQLFNILLKDAALPLYPHLINEKIIIKSASEYFVNAVLKDEKIGVNLFHNKAIKDIQYYEIFSPYEMLKDFEFYKEREFEKKHIKDYDIFIQIIDFNSPNDTKINIGKKPTVAIVNYSGSHEEFLSYFAIIKNSLSDKYKISQVIDLDIEMLFLTQGFYEKFSIFENLSLLETKLQSSINDDDITQIKDNLTNQEIVNKKLIQFQKITEIKENIYQISQNAKLNRNINMLKEVLEKVKNILKSYKSLLLHYNTLYTNYHKASKSFIKNLHYLNDEYEKEIHKSISLAIKSYLDSIVESISENLEPIKLKIRQKNNSFLFLKKEVVIDTFLINCSNVFKEVENNQSILSRKHRALLSQINSLKISVNKTVLASLKPLNLLIEDWIKSGHYLTLKKKPNFISMNPFFDLEEFNINANSLLMQDYTETINNFLQKINSRLVELDVWVRATQNLLLECIIRRMEQALHNNKQLLKSGKEDAKRDLIKIDNNLIIEIIHDLLPSKLSNIFITISSLSKDSNLENLLQSIRKRNLLAIKERLKEILFIKKMLTYSIKELQDVINLYLEKLEKIVT